MSIPPISNQAQSNQARISASEIDRPTAPSIALTKPPNGQSSGHLIRQTVALPDPNTPGKTQMVVQSQSTQGTTAPPSALQMEITAWLDAQVEQMESNGPQA